MGHSAVFSEPIAWICALALGLVAVFVGQSAGMQADAALGFGSAIAVITSVLAGAPINAALLDVLALIAVRPLTAWGVWEVMGSAAKTLVS
jgi:hypothetical protein